MTQTSAPVLSVLSGMTVSPPPVWFMRQAGRYLPEYRALRASTSGFVDFCLNPEKAAEATLQPIRRFGFDAAILFSDILMIPLALGQDLTPSPPVRALFSGELPSLELMQEKAGLAGDALKNVGETLQRVKANLDPHTTLIGFCGGPWTVMTYMLNGKKAHDRSLIRAFVYDDPKQIQAVMEIVIEASAQYLLMQAQSGAEVLKIFESWAEGFPDPYFQTLVVDPHIKLIQRVRQLGVTLPIIGFPRGAEARCRTYLDQVPVDALALGTATPLALGAELQKIKADPGRARSRRAALGWCGAGRCRRPHSRRLGSGALDLQSGSRHLPRHPDRTRRTSLEADTRPMSKVAVLLINLGGPETQADVGGFLYNLFADRRIITLPFGVRQGVAAAIAHSRTPAAQANYRHMGGGSPILAETRAQADALAGRCSTHRTDIDARVFVGMRYWHPFIAAAAAEIDGLRPG